MLPRFEHLDRVRCQMKTGLESSIEHQTTFWPFSSAKPRGSHRCSKRFFRTERPFSLAPRIGSVIREQRPARATTRTTGRSLNSASGVSAQRQLEGEWWTPVGQGGVINRRSKNAVRLRTLNSEIIRWSSRPSPVNRLQATGEPRRVMLGGSKSCALGSEEQDRPAPVATQGKLSLSPKNSPFSTDTVQTIPKPISCSP